MRKSVPTAKEFRIQLRVLLAVADQLPEDNGIASLLRRCLIRVSGSVWPRTGTRQQSRGRPAVRRADRRAVAPAAAYHLMASDETGSGRDP